jgi:hypothetical protein
MNNNASAVSWLLRRWSVKTLLGTALVAEMSGWLLLRGDTWRTLGLGWQFWSLLLVTTATLTLAVIAAAHFVRRRAQFELRTLMVLVLFVGTGLGLTGIHLQSTEKQRSAAAALKQIGAEVSYAGEEQPGLLTFTGRQYFQEPIALRFFGTLRESDLANIEALIGLEALSLGKSLADDDLAHLLPLKRLCTLNLMGSRVTGRGLQHLPATSDLRTLNLCQAAVDDNGLEYVGQLRTLMDLSLNQTRITDAGLAHLATLSELRVLWLDNDRITGSGLVHLRHLRHLKHLGLQGTLIGNAELASLGELRSLTWLALTNTGIDDNGVEALCGMSGLKTLALHGTNITEEGLRRLERALPGCKISHQSKREE